ncbi:hypothetical protein P5673_032915 [Acropora cervicornis]|uniref:EGF-like domain-containing protein n=1 Tax=Acropora cervicornis TaxID=6130 RepID=A0AAD9PQM9_ACRCE|nr:hypothetical protein P5673_032915 [Acropora cervicornis]
MSMMLYVFYLMFMISARQTNGEQCKVYQVSIYGKALHGHTYKTAKVRGLLTCYVLCDRDPVSKSCNFKHTKDICEMNNQTKETKPNDFISDEQSYYIKRTDVDECTAFPNICGANADCHNTDGSYNCNCKTGYSGDGNTCSREPGDKPKIYRDGSLLTKSDGQWYGIIVNVSFFLQEERNKPFVKMWMSVCWGYTLAVLSQCAATPKDHITAAVRQITLATDKAAHG